jgi:hypothetical protein
VKLATLLLNVPCIKQKRNGLPEKGASFDLRIMYKTALTLSEIYVGPSRLVLTVQILLQKYFLS